jgi:hypothetical protein
MKFASIALAASREEYSGNFCDIILHRPLLISVFSCYNLLRPLQKDVQLSVEDSPLYNIQDVLNILSALSIIIGIPVALFQYLRTTRLERKAEVQRRQDEREKLYDALDQRFVEYQKLCLQYPYLDVADHPHDNPIVLDQLQRNQERILIVILFTLFESAYLLLFLEGDEEVRKKQWLGWDRYIRFYMARPNFYASWKEGFPKETGTGHPTGIEGIGTPDHTFHEDFEIYMNEVVDAIEKKRSRVSLE